MAMGEMDMLAGLDAMAADPEMGMGGGLTCQVCLSELDPATGEPLSEVTEENVQAVEAYQLMGAGDPLAGGELDGLPADPGAMGTV